VRTSRLDQDLTALKGVRFTSGSRTSADFIAPVDAPAAERVKQQGACIIGKTTTTEFGCKASSSSPLTGTTLNPWNLTRTPGGSSSGAGASVAAGVTPFALGTDGGGSIRIPASFCGLFGIKAHFGRVAIFPTSATPTLAHVGPMARSVRDAALLLGVISGWDARDPAAVAADTPDYLAACERSPKGLRIAWSPTLGYAKPMPEVVRLAEAQVRTLEGLGCERRTGSSISWGLRATRIGLQPNSPTATGGSLRSHARWQRVPACFCSMSLPQGSLQRRSWPWPTSFGSSSRVA